MKNGYQVIDLKDVVLTDSSTSTIKKDLILQLVNCENKPLRFINAYLEEDGIDEPVLYGFATAIATKDYVIQIGGVFWFELDVSAWDGESDISITMHYGAYLINPAVNGGITFGDDSVLNAKPTLYLHRIMLSKTTDPYPVDPEYINIISPRTTSYTSIQELSADMQNGKITILSYNTNLSNAQGTSKFTICSDLTRVDSSTLRMNVVAVDFSGESVVMSASTINYLKVFSDSVSQLLN